MIYVTILIKIKQVNVDIPYVYGHKSGKNLGILTSAK